MLPLWKRLTLPWEGLFRGGSTEQGNVSGTTERVAPPLKKWWICCEKRQDPGSCTEVATWAFPLQFPIATAPEPLEGLLGHGDFLILLTLLILIGIREV